MSPRLPRAFKRVEQFPCARDVEQNIPEVLFAWSSSKRNGVHSTNSEVKQQFSHTCAHNYQELPLRRGLIGSIPGKGLPEGGSQNLTSAH